MSVCVLVQEMRRRGMCMKATLRVSTVSRQGLPLGMTNGWTQTEMREGEGGGGGRQWSQHTDGYVSKGEKEEGRWLWWM